MRACVCAGLLRASTELCSISTINLAIETGRFVVHHALIAAAATALALGAGAGAITTVGPSERGALESDAANPMIGGQAMLMDRDIVANIARSPEHARLVAALNNSGLEPMLKGKGPFTLFAPIDTAFGNLTKCCDERHLRYFVVAGRLDSRALLERINQNGGDARLKTAEGGIITASLNGPTNIVLPDEDGQVADIVIYDIYNSNGVTQVIDRVISPGRVPPRAFAEN